jgi:AcrR family transcriptional regulator
VDDERGAASAAGSGDGAQQRAMLLDAAAQVFTARGFTSTSADEIAAVAGLPVHVLHAHYPDLDQLLLDVLASRVGERLTEAGWMVGPVTGNWEDAAAAMGRLLAAIADKDLDTATLRAELWLHAMRHPETMARFGAQARALDAVLADIVRTLFARPDPGFDVPAETLATVLTALFEGLVRRRRADPAAVPEDLFEKTLQWLIAGARAGGHPA